ncbi:hypothetical protein [Nesterenkonia sphaerica]|uniref:Uncharacterized protein n=1 Tax=Nesterenkonia sphaerica TaxID=1804988 RepID=A0A5R9ABR4_9MICC|nr:hypothetical protein [Nesterenkonia sphaerica]TLP75287.1 hypothetical protein FEF27_08170 [Nesterenkonia sphaerica]
MMTPREVNALLLLARHHDTLVVNTDAAARTMEKKLPHVPFEPGVALIEDDYGSHPEPHSRVPMDTSVLRILYGRRRREFEAKQRAREPSERKP